MRWETVERRIVAALQPVEVNTGRPVTTPVLIRGQGIRQVRKPGGVTVITRAPQLEAYVQHFEAPPAQPAPGTVALPLDLEDPRGRYLPRRYLLRLPRPPGDGPEALFRAQAIPLYPSPSGPVPAGAAVLRVTVTDGDGTPLPAAYLRVLRTVNGNTTVLARGLTDWRGRARGEGLICVPGIPVTTWGEENGADQPVLLTTVDAELEASFDASLALAEEPPAAGAFPNPDVLEQNLAALPNARIPVSLASGRTLTVTLVINLP